MTEPQTEAGKALLTARNPVSGNYLAAFSPDRIIAIEAESRNATLDEVVRVVEGLPLPPMYFDGPPTWTDGTDAMRAAVLDAVKALRGEARS